jgi:adenosine deaminase
MADEQIPITVCPTSNVVIARCFDRLEDHTYPRMRAAGLLATVNTDDPALSDLNLGQEYAAVARAFDYTWGDMVQIALDGVESCWLPESDKAALRRRIIKAGTTLRPDDDLNA